MELRFYAQIILSHWKIIFVSFAFTLAVTFFLVSRQPWIYEARTTAVIRPELTDDVPQEDIVKFIDTLSNRVEINTTYSQIASSKLIKQQAIEALGLSSAERRGLKVSSKVIPGTNVLEIKVQGPQPVIVRDFANAVSTETFAYASNLYDIFVLEPLDQAELPKNPSGPNKVLNLAVGAIFGLLLGLGAAILLEYLKETKFEHKAYMLLDDKTGFYHPQYFLKRVEEEISRTKHAHTTFSLALLKISTCDFKNRPDKNLNKDDIQEMGEILKSNLRAEDIICQFDATTFAILLPNLIDEMASSFVETLQPPVSHTDNTRCVACIISYVNSEQTVDALLTEAFFALEKVDMANHGKSILSPYLENEQFAANSDDMMVVQLSGSGRQAKQ